MVDVDDGKEEIVAAIHGDELNVTMHITESLFQQPLNRATSIYLTTHQLDIHSCF